MRKKGTILKHSQLAMLKKIHNLNPQINLDQKLTTSSFLPHSVFDIKTSCFIVFAFQVD